jgi:hypothetical protein
MADACNNNEETNVYFEALDASKIPDASSPKRPEQMNVHINSDILDIEKSFYKNLVKLETFTESVSTVRIDNSV